MREIPRGSKVAVGLSGGVDSAVAAALLVEQGYEVLGLFMHLWHEDRPFGFGGNTWENKCCSTESLEAARGTASKLGIPLYMVDYRQDFRETVVEPFLAEYRAGRTPNPCVFCNKFIKFGKLLEYARTLGCDYLATGHYAQIEELGERYLLKTSADPIKDQTYFLWQLSQSQLEHILFPVGGLTKPQVRELASERSLPSATRPESFEICFIADSLEDFLRREIPEEIKPGPVIDSGGEVIGQHVGLPLYTYGQRRGFELQKYQGIPLYVVGMDRSQNALIVGRGVSAEVRGFAVERVNWIAEPPSDVISCLVRVRHQGELLVGSVEMSADDHGMVSLVEPTWPMAPGQSAVFYQDDKVLGGGIIAGLDA